MSVLLATDGLSAWYGGVQGLRPTNIAIAEGEFVAVLGPNGAGKSTLLRAIMRLVSTEGCVRYCGSDVTAAPTHVLASRGLILVPEGRGIFGPLTVLENLEMGRYCHAAGPLRQDQTLAKVFAIFPRLRERLGQTAGSLSGGEQQMLAIARALLARPRLLMLDEPSLGLAPRLAAEILGSLAELNRQGTTILLVEQRAPLALKLAQRAYVLGLGRVVADLPTSEIRSHHDLARYYLA